MEVQENESGIASFVLGQLKRELDGQRIQGIGPIQKKLKPGNNEPILELVGNLEGIRSGRQKLFLRDAMSSAVDKILWYLAGNPERWLLLGGTRGCGKTVVGLLVVVLLAARGHVVMYHHRGVTMLLMTKNVSDQDKASLDEIFEFARIPPIPLSDGVWELQLRDTNHLTFRNEYLKHRNFIFVQDLDDDQMGVPVEDSGGKRLIVSSPNAHRLEYLGRKDLAKLIIMPTWTLEEIQQLEAVDPNSVVSRFERVGGIPRWVVDGMEHVTERLQDEQIRTLPASSIAIVFNEYCYLTLPLEVDMSAWRSSDLIFHIEPKSESNHERCKVVLASSYVMNRLVEQYLKGTEAELLQFALVVHKSDRLSDLRMKTLEGTVHRAIKRGRENMVFYTMSTYLLDSENEPTPVRTDVPTMKFETVNEFVGIAEIPLEQLCKGSYFHTKRTPNEATTIDAFALVDEAFVKQQFPKHPALEIDFGRRFKAEDKLFVLFIQTTVANKHVVDANVLLGRQEELRERLRLPQLPMVLCFISWSRGITQRQQVTRMDKTQTKRVKLDDQQQFDPQYVIQLGGKFDEIARLIF